MTESELKELLMGSILALGYHMICCEKYKQALKTDNTWQDAVDKSIEKLKQMVADIRETLDRDFTMAI